MSKKAITILWFAVFFAFIVAGCSPVFSATNNSVKVSHLDVSKTGWVSVIIQLKQPASIEVTKVLPFF